MAYWEWDDPPEDERPLPHLAGFRRVAALFAVWVVAVVREIRDLARRSG